MSRPAVSLFQRTGETGEIGKFNYGGRRERERGGSRKSGDCLHELFFLTRSLYPLRGVFHGVKSVNLSLILFRG